MNIKNNFKKFILLFLVTASFTFLFINLNSKAYHNNITYAESNTESQNYIEIVKREGIEYFHFIDTPFYFHKKYFEKFSLNNQYCKDYLDKSYKEAKEKIQSNLGLTYPDNLQIPIYVLPIIDLSLKTSGRFCRLKNCIKLQQFNIYICIETLAHEMTHALLCNFLGQKGYFDLNRGINEGLATQNNNLNHFTKSTELPNQNIFFPDFYPRSYKEQLIFYGLHQHMIHDWIEAEGKDVVKKLLERVKNGEDSVKVFLELGGDKIAQKYNCTIVPRSKFAKFLKEKLDLITWPFRFLIAFFKIASRQIF